MTSKYLTKKPFLIILIRSYMQILLASVPVIFSNRKKKIKPTRIRTTTEELIFQKSSAGKKRVEFRALERWNVFEDNYLQEGRIKVQEA